MKTVGSSSKTTFQLEKVYIFFMIYKNILFHLLDFQNQLLDLF